MLRGYQAAVAPYLRPTMGAMGGTPKPLPTPCGRGGGMVSARVCMCGRFDFHGEPADIQASFGVSVDVKGPAVRCYNLAPTMSATTLVSQHGTLALQTLTFGRRRRQGGLWINVRAESILDRLAGGGGDGLQTCGVLANGFFEWRAKQPYYFQLAHQPLMALAALRQGDHFMILTCEPNPLAATIHPRMPVILDRHSLNGWLHGALPQPLAYPQEHMVMHPVGRGVNDARMDGPECIVPITL